MVIIQKNLFSDHSTCLKRGTIFFIDYYSFIACRSVLSTNFFFFDLLKLQEVKLHISRVATTKLTFPSLSEHNASRSFSTYTLTNANVEKKKKIEFRGNRIQMQYGCKIKENDLFSSHCNKYCDWKNAQNYHIIGCREIHRIHFLNFDRFAYMRIKINKKGN